MPTHQFFVDESGLFLLSLLREGDKTDADIYTIVSVLKSIKISLSFLLSNFQEKTDRCFRNKHIRREIILAFLNRLS